MRLILASSSPYRKSLLERLRIDFECYSPDIDESPLEDEPHHDMVVRLAKEKAFEARKRFPEAICIGSDTIASYNNQILGKPGNLEQAIVQLKALRGQSVDFLTGLSVIGGYGQALTKMVPTTVQFKEYSDAQIERYCKLEEPFNSSGSFKSETAACALTQNITSDDPTAIMGLPLISLSMMLEEIGLPVL